MRTQKPTRRGKVTAQVTQNSARVSETPVFPQGIHDWSGHSKAGARWEVHRGDTVNMLKQMSSERFQCAVTSPPYFWQRDYQVDGQIGLEPKIEDYVQKIIKAMDEVNRVLKKDGVLFLNLGDTYYSGKGMPRGRDKRVSLDALGFEPLMLAGLECRERRRWVCHGELHWG